MRVTAARLCQSPARTPMKPSPTDRHRGPVTAGDLVRFAIVAVYLLTVLALLLLRRRLRLQFSIRQSVKQFIRSACLRLAFRGG